MRRCIPGSTGAWTRPSTYSKRWPLSLRAWLSPPKRDRKFSTLAQQEAETVLLRYQIGSQRSKIEVPAKSVCVTRGRPVDVLPHWCRRHVNKGTAFFDFYGIPEFGIMCKVLDVQADRTLSWTVERERERGRLESCAGMARDLANHKLQAEMRFASFPDNPSVVLQLMKAD